MTKQKDWRDVLGLSIRIMGVGERRHHLADEPRWDMYRAICDGLLEIEERLSKLESNAEDDYYRKMGDDL